MTDREAQVLKAIRNSEYNDSGMNYLAAVWIDCLWDFEGQERALGGLLTSLQTKGLVEVDPTPGESTVRLTAKGLALIAD